MQFVLKNTHASKLYVSSPTYTQYQILLDVKDANSPAPLRWHNKNKNTQKKPETVGPPFHQRSGWLRRRAEQHRALFSAQCFMEGRRLLVKSPHSRRRSSFGRTSTTAEVVMWSKQGQPIGSEVTAWRDLRSQATVVDSFFYWPHDVAI